MFDIKTRFDCQLESIIVGEMYGDVDLIHSNCAFFVALVVLFWASITTN